MNVQVSGVKSTGFVETEPLKEVSPAKTPQSVKTDKLASGSSSDDSSIDTRSKKSSTEKEDVKGIVDSLNEYSSILKTQLGFSVNEKDDKVIVMVKNRETDEVIRQIPSEELMKIQETMEELTGLILDKKV